MLKINKGNLNVPLFGLLQWTLTVFYFPLIINMYSVKPDNSWTSLMGWSRVKVLEIIL